MTPRETDRYEAKAREVTLACRHVGTAEVCNSCVAAALRAVKAETLERAAQALDSHRYINASKIVRALASPAAAPAAEPSEPAAPAYDFFADHSDAEVQAALDDVRGKAPAQGAEARIAELEYALRMTREHALNAGCRGYLGSNFFDRIDAALAARAATQSGEPR